MNKTKKKNRKPPRTIQTSNPTSYSWAYPETSKKVSKIPRKVKKNSSYKQEKLYVGCCHRVKARRKSDPYAPHLKYGIFPRPAPKNTSELNVTSSINKASGRSSARPSGLLDRPTDKLPVKKKKVKKESLTAIKPTNKPTTLPLKMSETLHLDIMPRSNMFKDRSPTRNYKPVFKTISPKMNNVVS